MMNCKEATKLMSDAQEKPLNLTEKMPLKLHTMMCSGCRNFEQQMGDLRRITRAYVQGKYDQVAKED